MAQFITVQGRLKLLVNGEGFSFHSKFRSVGSHKRKVKFIGSSSSYLSGKTNRCKVALSSFSNGSVHDEGDLDHDDYEFENDSLACFRGLVLDLSYRSLLQYLLSFSLLLCIARI